MKGTEKMKVRGRLMEKEKMVETGRVLVMEILKDLGKEKDLE